MRTPNITPIFNLIPKPWVVICWFNVDAGFGYRSQSMPEVLDGLACRALCRSLMFLHDLVHQGIVVLQSKRLKSLVPFRL